MRKEIDGAEVIKYTKSKDFGFVEFENSKNKQITVLAICNYDQKDVYYLFACDEQLNVLGDTLHYTVEDAVNFAKEYYDQREIEWQDL